MSGQVFLERSGPVGWVMFDNPARHNAVNGPMLGQLVDVLEKAAADEAIRVIALRGAGEEAFVSGADISAFGSASGVESGPSADEFLGAITGMDKPVVAALRGWCLGGGALLAFAADIRIAGDDVRVGIPASRLGAAYPKVGLARVVQLAGPAVAAEMLMTGDQYDAKEALRVGLVNRVVPAGSVFDEAQRLAERIAGRAPLTIAASKRTIEAVLDPSDVAASVAADAAITSCFRSEDFREGQQAFIGKRPPDFKGR